MIERPRLFAIIPAAGRSRRMGQPKLLMPFGESTVIERVLSAIAHPTIVSRCVVVRSDDEALAAAVRQAGGRDLTPPTEPPDMRSSVAFAIESIRQEFNPSDTDGWMLVPADHPVLDPNLVQDLIRVWERDRPLILVPRCGTRRGHPTLFRWSLAHEVASIPEQRGLNWLLEKHARSVRELEVEGESSLWDLDTPEDYERLRRLFP